MSEPVYEIQLLKFDAADTKVAHINGELAKYPGYEPFDSWWAGGTWTLLLRRQVAPQEDKPGGDSL